MDTRFRTAEDTPDNLARYFLTPTGFTFSDFRASFGEEIAKAVYTNLYKVGCARNSYRQISPVRVLADRNTKKYAFELSDQKLIETVIIKRRTGNTVCLSTQVGCQVRCRFCKSGENGLVRNLSASEMIQQFIFANGNANRIVFMGIGEPLMNYSELIRVIHILRDRNGLDFPTDGISISTVGPIDKLKLLREEHIKIQLVLSLHATDQQTRDYLMPGTARHSINEVISLSMDYGRRHNRKISIAYLLLPGINDRTVDVERLSRWFGGKNVVVNLLRYNGNKTNEFFPASPERISSFMKALEKNSVRVTLRRSLGDSIEAACGQLVPKG